MHRLEEKLKNTRLTILFRLLASAIFCGMVPLATSAADLIPFTDITPAQAAELIKAKGADPLFKILDVRTTQEFSENRIKDALNIDVKALDFKEKIEKLDKNGTYLAYCKGGVRSARAMNLMKELGFKLVYNLGGGLIKWQEEKQPLEGAPLQAAAPAGPGPSRPASGSHAWLDGKKTTTIPFRLSRNHVHILAEVNGTKKLDLILDTGMPAPGVLLLEGPAVRELNLAYAGEAMIAGAGGGTSPAKIATGLSLKIGDLLLKEQTAIVKTADPADPAPVALNLDTNGVIGYALFSRFVVAIDYDRMLITFSIPEDFNYQGRGTGMPMDITTNFPFIDCVAQLTDGSSIALKMIVDLGASHALSLNIGAQPEIKTPAQTIEFWGRGAGSEVSGRLGRIKGLAIGKFALKNVVAGFYTTKLMPMEKDGNLGNDALRRFNLVFDYSRQTLIVEPNSNFSAPFESAMSGFQADKTGSGEFVITHVLPSSPATEAGLLMNDRIVEINGLPAARVSIEDLFKSSIKVGESLKLTIRRGEAQFTKVMKLRRLI